MNKAFFGDCRDVLRDLIAEGVNLDAVFIENFSFFVEPFHVGSEVLWSGRSASVPSTACHPRFHVLFFGLAKLNTVFCLFGLNAKKWQKRLKRLRTTAT